MKRLTFWEKIFVTLVAGCFASTMVALWLLFR